VDHGIVDLARRIVAGVRWLNQFASELAFEKGDVFLLHVSTLTNEAF
jgi:hypothetical protein